MKKLLKLFLSSIMVMSIIIPKEIVALEKTVENENVLTIENSMLDENLQIVVNEENNFETKAGLPIISDGFFTFSLVRSGNTPKCELIVKWNGDFAISGIRFTKLTVYETTIFSLEYFHYLYTGDNIYRMLDISSKLAYIHIDYVYIPVDVQKVKVKFGGLQLCDINYGWLSGIIIEDTVTIK